MAPTKRVVLLVTQGLPEALEHQEKPELPATQVQKESRIVALSLSYRLARTAKGEQ